MIYCPKCGKKLEKEIKIENKLYHQCHCGYIDWNNWVNVSTVVVATNDNDEFLMVRIRKTGKYTFPGGFRDLGESLEEAAKRECFEESGYIIKDLELFHTNTMDSNRLVWIVFKAKIDSGHFIENDEVDQVKFVSIEELAKLEPMRGPLSSGLRDKITHSINNKNTPNRK
jgi:NADH pyrophosphatase NudC (nudix superfamily)